MKTGYFISGMQACMVLLLICLMGVFSGGNAYADTDMDKEDPLYWRYYDADGNLKDNGVQDDAVEYFSSGAMMESIDVTDGEIYSPYYPRQNINSTNYYTTKNGRIAHGIDVSKWNKDVDYEKVKAAGIDYVWIRCGYRGYGSSGSMGKDEYFAQNLKNALAAGLKVGVYVFSQAITEEEGIEEADLALDMLGDDLYRLELPIVIDVEYIDTSTASNGGRLMAAKLSNKKQTDIIRAFGERIKECGGTAAVYASVSMFKKGSSQKFDPSVLAEEGIGLWLARYSTKTGYDEEDYIAWQYDSGAKVDGCTGGEAKGADVNFIYEDSLLAMYPDDSRCNFYDVSVPNKVKATGGVGKITVSWAQQEDVSGYVVMRKKETDSNWSRVATIWKPDTVSYVDKSVSAGTIYQYKISSILSKDGMDRSEYSKIVYSRTKPDAPYAAVAGQTSSTDSSLSVKITWDPVSEAAYYLLYRKIDDGKYETIYKGTDYLYTDSAVELGGTYTYKVRAALEMPDGSKVYSKYSTEMVHQVGLDRPSMKRLVSDASHTMTMTWTSVPWADGYRVYRKVAGGSYGGYIAIVKEKGDGTVPSYTDNTAETGVQYYYKVRAYVKTENYGKIYSEYAKPLRGYSMPEQVKSISLQSARYDRLKLNWEPIEGVDGYMIQQLEADGTRSNVADVSPEADSYTIKGLACGTQYKFAVCGYVLDDEDYVFGELDPTGLKCKPVPTMPTGKFTSSTKGKVNITWNKIAGVTGYLIYYKATEDGDRKVKARPMAEDARKIEVSGKSGTTCYYAVRAYRKVGDKTIYSKYEWIPVKVK